MSNVKNESKALVSAIEGGADKDSRADIETVILIASYFIAGKMSESVKALRDYLAKHWNGKGDVRYKRTNHRISMAVTSLEFFGDLVIEEFGETLPNLWKNGDVRLSLREVYSLTRKPKESKSAEEKLYASMLKLNPATVAAVYQKYVDSLAEVQAEIDAENAKRAEVAQKVGKLATASK